MPKISPQRQTQRRDQILDAAERCFGRAGFHPTTMAEICREAGVSAGGAYLYFKSKEELIAGIIERDRTRMASDFAALATAPDLIAALEALTRQFLFHEPEHRRRMMMEINVESLRNPAIQPACLAADRDVLRIFRDALAAQVAAGRIRPRHDIDVLAEVLMVMGEGLFTRATIDKQFDPERALPVFLETVALLIGATPIPSASRPRLRSLS
ncbi:MAG: TetR/AcrR family transcriptional regulator [Beijerinckiaceae bacterium]